MDQVTELSKIIAESVSKLQTTCSEKKLNFPDINATGFEPTSEAFRADSQAADAAKIIAAASLQLAATVMSPQDVLYRPLAGCCDTAALKYAEESNFAEILREVGPKGLHVNDIAKKAGVNANKAGRFLRYLATHHVFREVEPDVFTNNRVSALLDSKMNVEDLIKDPNSKYNENNSFGALIAMQTGVFGKGCAFISEALKQNKSAISLAFNFEGSVWAWLEQPENLPKLKMAGIAMQGAEKLQPPNATLDAFDWSSLPESSIVVDVGGGFGAAAMSLEKAHKQLKIIVQDRPKNVEAAVKVCELKNPDALSSQRVTFQAHDFFTEQPIKSASVFLLKQIIHDWPDEPAVNILKQLRASATPKTTLIIMDSIVPYACEDTSTVASEIEGGVPDVKAPWPVLPNYGAVNEKVYHADIAMMLGHDAQERTLGELQLLLKKGGWQLKKVVRGDTAFLQSIQAIPI